MEARLNLFTNAVAAKTLKHFVAAGKELAATSTIPGHTLELVTLRASQINGCAVCVDMHTKDLLAGGESTTRVNLVAAWREATVFTDAERAALDFVEQATRIADGAGGVPDEVWAGAAKHYDEDEMAALVSITALINAFNRLNVATQQPAGAYVAGQYA
ncbi:carboxymuconolactone decarboxylase family protein [Streptomyces sp. NBC_01789]|uniref:carboxymuconolactone decarboxylase family protein n=1 Tax=Streptomyces sp. NBC_01789 TaxID=2975941 RepID=UPI00224F438F|nr:carboxymuconolactone decarboxylase family protein [Streptomyces sp. NBC_01789]MCX4446634.1 carboxymuconolactone decarboxylase family protein [Streptomyces sp. NBC_01789]